MDFNDFEKLNQPNQVIFQNLMKSQTYQEYELHERINHLEKFLKEKLHQQSQKYEFELKKQKTTFDEELGIKIE